MLCVQLCLLFLPGPKQRGITGARSAPRSPWGCWVLSNFPGFPVRGRSAPPPAREVRERPQVAPGCVWGTIRFPKRWCTGTGCPQGCWSRRARRCSGKGQRGAEGYGLVRMAGLGWRLCRRVPARVPDTELISTLCTAARPRHERSTIKRPAGSSSAGIEAYCAAAAAASWRTVTWPGAADPPRAPVTSSAAARGGARGRWRRGGAGGRDGGRWGWWGRPGPARARRRAAGGAWAGRSTARPPQPPSPCRVCQPRPVEAGRAAAQVLHVCLEPACAPGADWCVVYRPCTTGTLGALLLPSPCSGTAVLLLLLGLSVFPSVKWVAVSQSGCRNKTV